MFYGNAGLDDFVGLADLAQLVLPTPGTTTMTAAQQRKCTAAQTAYTKRAATFQTQLSKAKTAAAASRIQANATKALTTLQTRMTTACNVTGGGSLVLPGQGGVNTTPPAYPGSYVGQTGVNAYGYSFTWNGAGWTPATQGGITGTGQPPTYAGSYVGQIVPDVSGAFSWSWSGTSWTEVANGGGGAGASTPPTYPGTTVGQVATNAYGYQFQWTGTSWIPTQAGGTSNLTPPTYAGSYVGQQATNAYGIPFTWNGSSWTQSSGGQACAAGYGPPGVCNTYNPTIYNQSPNLYSGTPWLEPAGQYPGAYPSYPQSYSPYSPYGGPDIEPIGGDYAVAGGGYPSAYGMPSAYGAPLLTPIDQADVSPDGQDIYGQAPGFPGAGGGASPDAAQCQMELSSPATVDAYGPLQTVQIVCAQAAPAASSGGDFSTQSMQSVEQSEIGMSGFAGLGRYLG